ncbi:MAG: hypothetical protein ACK5AZ_00895 [Bryobacteraceae bacterium]
MNRAAATGLFALLALAPSIWLAWLHRDVPALIRLHDSGVYFGSAKTLAEGDGYRIASLPGQPAQTKYPPLYPLYLSIAWLLNPSFPENLPLAALLSWLWVPALGIAAWMTYRRFHLPHSHALLLAGAVVLNPVVVLLGPALVSELMFTTLLLAALWMAERGSGSLRWAVAAAILGGLAYLTRSAALPLLVSAPLVYLAARRYRQAAAFFLAMLPFLIGWKLWTARNQLVSTDPALIYYTDYIALLLRGLVWEDLPLIVWKNLGELLRSCGRFIVFNGAAHGPAVFLSQVLGIFCIAGAIRLIRATGVLHYGAYAAISLPMLLAWVYPPEERLVAPLFPLLYAGFYAEARHIFHLLRTNLSTRTGRALGGAAIAVFLWWNVYVIDLRYLPDLEEGERAILEDSKATYRWIAANLPPDARLLSDQDPAIYLYTGRAAMRPDLPTRYLYRDELDAFAARSFALDEFAREHNLGYLMITPMDIQLRPEHRREILRRIKENTNFGLLFDAPAAKLYKVEVQP